MNKNNITDAEIDAQLEKAWELNDELEKIQPRAKRAWYDAETGEIWIELKTGVKAAFPHHLLQGLENATPEQLAEVRPSPSGYGLRWESLDTDLSVPGLMAQVFGTQAWMAELGRAGGKMTSPQKAAAAKRNGQKGGRPKKSTSIPD